MLYGSTPHALALGSDFMIVAGEVDVSTSPVNSQWRIEKRMLSNGSLAAGFGEAGVVTSNPSVGVDVAKAVEIDAEALYAAGYDGINGIGDLQWRVEKRQLSDGGLVPEFGTAGVVSSNPSASSDTVVGIALAYDAIILLGSDETPGGVLNSQWRYEMRAAYDGALIPGFGTGGVVVSNPSGSIDTPQGLVLDDGSIYAVGVDSTPGNWNYAWRIEQRNLWDGAPDATFGPITTN
jgi:hypothetical protein